MHLKINYLEKKKNLIFTLKIIGTFLWDEYYYVPNDIVGAKSNLGKRWKWQSCCIVYHMYSLIICITVLL